jgi:uncharacterized protein
MGRRPRVRATLAEILASTSDALFPAALGEAHVAIDSRDCDGDTPLHVTVWRHDPYGVETLINAGSDVSAIGDMGQTPLHVAVGQASVPVIKALLNAGARADIRSELTETARERAAKQGGEVAKLLLSRP